MTEHQKHAQLIKPTWGEAIPQLFGLVLAGGESRRMGLDKSEMNYHGIPQQEYISALLRDYVREVYVSKRDKEEGATNVIKDTFLDLGPYSGILSAFRFDPNVAWLTIPCDMPLIDGGLIANLIAGRDHQRMATCFHDPSTGFPEPLLTIWEPRAYPVLLQKLGEGISCLRKSLIQGDVKVIHPPDPQQLRNANTPEEAEYFRNIIRKS